MNADRQFCIYTRDKTTFPKTNTIKLFKMIHRPEALQLHNHCHNNILCPEYTQTSNT